MRAGLGLLALLRQRDAGSEGDAVAASVEVVHGLDGEEDQHFAGGVFLTDAESQAMFATVIDDFLEDLVDGVLIFAGPAGDGFAKVPADAFEIGGGGGVFAVFLGVREEASDITIVKAGVVESVEVPFLLVMFAECLFELADGIDVLAGDDDRFFVADLLHEVLNEFEFFEGGPALILLAPAGTGAKPDGEGFREILDGMGLGVPHIEVQDEFFAVGAGFVVAAVGLGDATEDFAIAAHSSEAVGIIDGVSGFMPEDAHALGFGGSLGFEHHAAFESDQARVGEIKGNGDTGDAVGSVPTVGEPEVRPEVKPPRIEFLIEFADPVFEHRPFDFHSEIADSHIEEFIVGQTIQIGSAVGLF